MSESNTLPQCGFDWLNFSWAGLRVHNIRHIHHHAARVSLRLRRDQRSRLYGSE